MRAHTLLGIGAATLALAGCRDGVPPFTSPPPEPPTQAARQVTFGYGHDRDPRWAPAGVTLLYHSTEFGTLPEARGVLLTLDPAAVRARPLFDDVQQRGSFMLVTPVFSPTGDRVAYMDLLAVDDVVACSVPLAAPPYAATICNTQPVLSRAALRVRRADATGSHLDDPSIQVSFPGPDPAFSGGGDGPYVQRIHPFQALHREEQALLFRPSWSPDGQRVVISNGLQLLVWRVGAAVFDTIPGTTDGVSPAWSPDGQWIAYTQYARGDSVSFACSCAAPGRVGTATHNRILYFRDAGRLVLIRPDGSGRMELGEGEDPTWSPDGQFIYALRDARIVRIPRAGGAATPIPDTQRARSPSVSPDGRWLAFSRAKTQDPKDHDIWLVSLSQ